MIKMKHRAIYGFTIVELLVAIVLIGILATISLISYSGISNKAIVTSLQSDLSSAALQLKMYNTEYGSYPQTMNDSNCPTTPISDTKYCLKSSSGNTLTYCPIAPYATFTLKGANTNGTNYSITDNAPPSVIGSQSAILSSGGTVTSSACTRTHTFSPGTYNLTTTAGGVINVTISGAGGGGGTGFCDSSDNFVVGSSGTAGSSSSFAVGALTWRANGGGAGQVGVSDCYTYATPGANGSSGTTEVSGGATMTGWLSAVGGGSTGGAGAYPGGGMGGSGGKLTGSFSITEGQAITVVSGAGGLAGSYASPGSAGLVTISYTF